MSKKSKNKPEITALSKKEKKAFLEKLYAELQARTEGRLHLLPKYWGEPQLRAFFEEEAEEVAKTIEHLEPWSTTYRQFTNDMIEIDKCTPEK